MGVDPRVNRAARWLRVSVRAPPRLEGGCRAGKGVIFPWRRSRSWGVEPVPPLRISTSQRQTRAAPARFFSANGSPAELLEGPPAPA